MATRGQNMNKATPSKADLRPREVNELPIDPGLRMLTCALFFEWRLHSSCSITPPFCLKPYDHTNNGTVYRSMYLEYMKYDSEYAAAIGILGSWPHWQKLLDCKWFQEHVTVWREEMRLRDESLAKSKLLSQTKQGNVTAARTILMESKPENKAVGRPSRKTREELAQKKREPHNDDLDAMLRHAERTGKE